MYDSVSSATQPSFNTESITNWAYGDVKYIDLAQSSSLVSRRQYRSGMIYPFSIEVVPSTTCPPQCRTMYKVETLPNTFIIRQSFKLAKESFLKATEEEREMVKSARWNDFRVMFDINHRNVGGVNILPNMVDFTETANDDTGYEYSRISNRELAPGTDQYFGFLSTSANNYLGMINEYQISLEASMAAPDPVGTFSDMPYDTIIEQVDPEDAEALQTVNEFPPYDESILQTQIQTHYIGIQNGVGAVGSAVPLKTSTPIILAPCGLIRITALAVDNSGTTPDDPISVGTSTFKVNMLNGKYRGLEAGKMI